LQVAEHNPVALIAFSITSSSEAAQKEEFPGWR
jgi:hypothetical protein